MNKRIMMEFDLDAPTLPKVARQIFRNHTRSTTALYERFFQPFDVEQKVWKLLVEIVPVVTKPNVRDLLGVFTIQIQGIPEQFLEASNETKPAMILDWLRTGVELIAQASRWPLTSFEDAARAVIASDFVNRSRWKGDFWNRSKTTACDIEIEHDVEEARIIASFRASDKEYLGSRVLFVTSPTEFAFVPNLGRAKWIDETCFELASKDGTQKWQAIVPDALPA